MKPPYNFVTEVGLYETSVIDKQTYRLKPDTLGSLLLSDALEGYLNRYIKERLDNDEMKPHHLHITDDYKPDWIPAISAASQ